MNNLALAIDAEPVPSMRPEVQDAINQLGRLNSMDSRVNSWNQLAKRIGVSAATLTRFVKGDYDGDVGAVLAKVSSFLQFELARAVSAPTEERFVETENARIVLDVLNFSATVRAMAMITGSAGLGKSFAVREFCRQHEGTIYIYMNSTLHPKLILSKIADKLKVPHTRVSLHDLYCNVVNKLRGSNRVIVIDDAHKCAWAYLELFREIHDEAQVGVVFIGAQSLYDRVTGADTRHKTDRGFDQIFSRLQRFHELSLLSVPDTLAILQAYFPEADEKIADYMNAQTQGSARALRNLCRLIQLQGGKLSVDWVDKSCELLILAA